MEILRFPLIGKSFFNAHFAMNKSDLMQFWKTKNCTVKFTEIRDGIRQHDSGKGRQMKGIQQIRNYSQKS